MAVQRLQFQIADVGHLSGYISTPLLDMFITAISLTVKMALLRNTRIATCRTLTVALQAGTLCCYSRARSRMDMLLVEIDT